MGWKRVKRGTGCGLFWQIHAAGGIGKDHEYSGFTDYGIAPCKKNEPQNRTRSILEYQGLPHAFCQLRRMRPLIYSSQRALRFLRLGTGIPNATFRPGQEEAIRHVVEGREGRLLVVQKTGWGKSFVYFIANRLLREAGAGPALLVSPLLSLMRNQIEAAKRMGVLAERITSDNVSEWAEVEEMLDRDEVDILLITPERLDNERFRTEVLARIAERISLFVIDECHCISDWGHDFRPTYRLIERFARTLPRNLRLLATTATANNRVMDDLREALGPDLMILRGPLARPSISLQTIRLPGQSQRLAWLAQTVPRLPGHGIIYTLTVRSAELVANWLRSRGIDVKAYSGKMGSEEREELERMLLENRVKALVATVALGMGFDKPDLGFVIHYQTPGSVVAYYQQVGRAGRALQKAYGVLLSGEEETEITDYFIEMAFPTRKDVRQVITALEGAPKGLSLTEFLRFVNLSKDRLKSTIALLSLESPAPVVKQGYKWQLGTAVLGKSFWARVERLTELRREEQRQMQAYVRLERGHMKFLVRALDGDPKSIERPRLPPLSTEIDKRVMRQAQTFLRRLELPIEPRKQWPYFSGLPGFGVKGRIAENNRAKEGRALCLWGDEGRGHLVRVGKQEDGRFDDELVEACAMLVLRWRPDPKPEWMTCIPSLRHPDLVPDFARRLAVLLGLLYLPVIEQTTHRPEQKSMANSPQQALNIDGSLAIARSPLPAAPVLLVDDVVGSRWTFTVAAWLLRKRGSGEVWPLALSTLGQT